MAGPRGRRIFVLVVVLAIAVFGCHREGPRGGGGATPIFYRVVVGPAADQVDPGELTINNSIEGKPSDEVFWILVDQQHQLDQERKLFIEFEKAEPFPQHKPQGNRFRLQCTGAFCQSGPVGKNASGKYKYWQIVQDPDGKEHPADGMIQIKP